MIVAMTTTETGTRTETGTGIVTENGTAAGLDLVHVTETIIVAGHHLQSATGTGIGTTGDVLFLVLCPESDVPTASWLSQADNCRH